MSRKAYEEIDTTMFICTKFGFYYSRIKKGEGQGKYITFSTMMYKEAGERLKMTTHHVPVREMIQ